MRTNFMSCISFLYDEKFLRKNYKLYKASCKVGNALD
jgi:hypothetical protein